MCARARDRAFYDSIRLHLVEASAEARAAQTAVLGDVAERLASSGPSLPASFDGVLIANELLDALPTHQVVMADDGLREIYVEAETLAGRGGPQRPALRAIEDAPSTPALGEYLARLGVELQPGWRVEINLRAVEWIREAARRLRRGFIIVVDYGHESRELYSPSHSGGNADDIPRASQRGERIVRAGARLAAGARRPGHHRARRLHERPRRGGRRRIADARLSRPDVLLLGLVDDHWSAKAVAESRMGALKTLVMPGGLGSTHKVIIFGKGVGNAGAAWLLVPDARDVREKTLHHGGHPRTQRRILRDRVSVSSVSSVVES